MEPIVWRREVPDVEDTRRPLKNGRTEALVVRVETDAPRDLLVRSVAAALWNADKEGSLGDVGFSLVPMEVAAGHLEKYDMLSGQLEEITDKRARESGGMRDVRVIVTVRTNAPDDMIVKQLEESAFVMDEVGQLGMTDHVVLFATAERLGPTPSREDVDLMVMALDAYRRNQTSGRPCQRDGIRARNVIRVGNAVREASNKMHDTNYGLVSEED